MRKQLRGSLALVVASFFWGTAFSAQSYAMRFIQPFTFVFMRSVVSCLALMAARPVIDRVAGERNISVAPGIKPYLVPGALIGLFLALATMVQQAGLVYTTPAKSGFISTLYIIIVPLMGLFMGRHVRPALWLGLALSLVGLSLLCVQADLSVNRGDMITLGSAALYSLQIITVSRYAAKLDPMKLSMVEFATCAVVSGAAAFLFEAPRIEGILACWQSILYVALFSGAVGYTLQLIGQRNTDPAVASLIMCLESVFAALGGWVLLGQSLTPRELLGCALMLSASVVAQLQGQRAK